MSPKTTSVAIVRREAPESPAPTTRSRRRRHPTVARVTLFNPRTIGALDAAVALGTPLRAAWDGRTLTIEAAS